MRDSKWALAAPLTGVVFVVLFAAGTVVINEYEFQPPAEEVKAIFEDGSSRIGWGSLIGVWSAAFLLWFAGSVRSSLRRVEGGTGRLSAVAFGGGIAAAGLLTVAYSALGAGASRGGDVDGIAAETATAFLDLSQWMFGGVAMGFAVLIGATAVVSFRTGFLARWLVWSSAVIAVGLLTPYSFLVLGLVVPWVLIISILLYQRGRAEATPEPA
jgi:hypothetical protein